MTKQELLKEIDEMMQSLSFTVNSLFHINANLPRAYKSKSKAELVKFHQELSTLKDSSKIFNLDSFVVCYFDNNFYNGEFDFRGAAFNVTILEQADDIIELSNDDIIELSQIYQIYKDVVIIRKRVK